MQKDEDFGLFKDSANNFTKQTSGKLLELLIQNQSARPNILIITKIERK